MGTGTPRTTRTHRRLGNGLWVLATLINAAIVVSLCSRTPVATDLAMIQLNVTTLAELTGLLLRACWSATVAGS
jgi:short-subunit dehydrogenase